MSIIASASNDLKFHQWPDGLIQQTYVPTKYDEGHIKSISWGKDGSWIVLVPHSGPAEIISIRDNVKLLQTIEEVQYPTCATFQNNTKKNIAVGTLSGQVLVYDIKSRNIRKRFPRAYSMINQLQYNATDSHLAAACTNGEIIVYNSMTSNLSSSYRIPRSSSVSSISFHRTKRNLLGAGSDEGVVAIWDINTNSPLLDMQAHHAPTTTLTFSPLRADMLVTGGLDRRFTFYDILAKKCILEVEVRSSITALDFSYCGTYLGLGSQAGGIVLYDTRNLSKPISAFPAHEGKRIRHLLFQKVLMPKDEQDNSSLDITAVASAHNNQQEEECNNQSVDTLSIAVIEDSVSVGDICENDKKASEEAQDSFLVALGWDNSSVAESEPNKESTVGLGITEGVKKWMDASKRSLIQQISMQQVPEQKSSTHTPIPLSNKPLTSKHLNDNLHNTDISPIVAPTQEIPSRKSVSLHNNVTINSTPVQNSQLNQMNFSPGEFKKMLREVIKEEFESQLEVYKNEVRAEFAETLGHMRRHFLDLQMSIVKEFVNMETTLEKMNNVTVKEFVCDDFLLNQNTKLLKELDTLKEQMVEKDPCRRKFS